MLTQLSKGLAVLAAAGAVAPVGVAAPALADVDGHWEGRIDIPGAPLHVKVDLARDGDAWRGTVDIPAQGAADLPLFRIRVRDGQGDAKSVEFAIRGVPGSPTFKGRFEAGRIRGEFEQGGASFGLRLSREPAGPTRPQEPTPPFPYTSEEVQFDNGPGHLAGTLTIPAGEGPFPAVLLLSGSGLQDRDQALFGHKPFWVLADHLSRAGVAVLRVDDAGAGESTPHPNPPTTLDFVDDADAAVDFLMADSRIGTVGLIGHSEGGLIAPLLASRRDDLGFIVLLAAPGVPGVELMRRQNERIFAAAGLRGKHRDRLLALVDQLFAVLMSSSPEAEVKKQVEEIVRGQLAANGVPRGKQRDDQVRTAAAQAMTPWLRYFLRHDPRPALLLTRVPVLALNGDLDVQVDAEQNLAAIETTLEEGGNRTVTTHSLPGVNHLFQTAGTGLVDEYATIEETMAPAVLDLIRDWILAQT